MATTTHPLLLISILFLFISSTHILSCFAITTQEGQVPSSVTPKAAAVHYWHHKTHNNKPLPPIFLSKLSPLSPSKLITTNDKTMRAMSITYASQDQSVVDPEPNILLYSKYDSHDQSVVEPEPNPLFYSKYDSQDQSVVEPEPNILLYSKYDSHDQSVVEPEPNILLYSKDDSQDRDATAGVDAKRATKHYNVDSNNNIKMVTGDEGKEKAAKQNSPRPRGIFFRESVLKEGKTIPSLKFAGRGFDQYFLPRSVASKIPLSASAISKIFHIPTDSALYRAMKRTIGQCRMPPNTGETKQCITSAEDLIDYALSTLGANTDIQFWSTHNSSGFGGKSLIGKVKVVYDGELTAKQHLTCHQETFPYMLYHCHSVSKTRIYDIEILNAETKENINQGAAVCHLNTTGWDPNHKSFAALASAPGMTEVCHWIPPWGMALTACDAAAATPTVA